jgi:hypothetical protein
MKKNAKMRKGDGMTQCKLSDRQRDLLRLIANGLKACPPEHGQWWIRMTHDHGHPAWQNVDDSDLMEQLQARTELGDLVMFEKCGFIENPEPGRYFLIEQRIIDAAENEFADPATPRPEQSPSRPHHYRQRRKSRGRKRPHRRKRK